MISHMDSTGGLARVPERSEVAEADTWDLRPLFAEDEAWEVAFRDVEERFARIGTFRGRLAEDPEVLEEALEFEKAIDIVVEKLNQYAALRVTEDSSDNVALSREARLENLLVRVAEAFSFLLPEIQSLTDDAFARYLDHPCLAAWTVPLGRLRRLKPHTLSPAEERLLALGGTVLRGAEEIFSQLTNVDMTFAPVEDASGAARPLTLSSFSSFLQQRERGVRKDAFEKFYSTFRGHQFTLAASLATSIRADVFRARARSYPSAREAALFSDNVPVAVYDNLISTVRSRLPSLFSYFDLRRKVLGVDEIHHYDTYVPMVADVQSDVPWDEAVAKVLRALKPLGAEYGEVLAHGLGDGRWCDRYENRGKRSGAFSYGTYTSPPYIMMNYKRDVFSDVYTLAHEAGHSMHTWYSQRAQSYQNYRYPIFLAEVASTFNEILLTEHLLSETTDRAMRAYLINRQVDDIRGTVFRQTMFAEFEMRSHAAEEADESLTLGGMTAIYRELLDAYFGPEFAIDDDLSLECLRIPHFYSAFYVYKYATGLAAAAALAAQVLETGDTTRYVGFLRSGSTRFPIDTLAEAGVDMRSSAPVEAVLDLFGRRVAELGDLLA